ncbi:SDR family oxidoreductase [Pleurocapsa sp. PCC 7319]|uniref:SDR family oxidoreductase n=1 Tax=Pleurocapsa sp. PCC 7319 TaxID=118161 RepID=UPI00034A6FE8|nr:SDR family oxidoreductase [Pleurocapsa sp. PCC 7319]
MKITIIGCGYVGSAVARLWHEAGDDVTVTTTSPDKKEQLKAIASEVAILSGNDLVGLKQVLADRDLVLLSVGAKQRTPEAYRRAYLETAQNVVSAIRATNSVQQLIYTSSYGILGNKSGAVIDETTSVNPITEGSKIMYQTEQVLLSVPESEFKTCVFRLSGIYGRGRELIKIFKRRAGTTQPGTGADYTNWVNLDDIVQAIAFAREQQLQGIYNLNSDQVLTTKEFFQNLFQVHNLSPITWDSSQASTRPYNMILSNQKLKDAGFKLTYPQIQFQ